MVPRSRNETLNNFLFFYWRKHFTVKLLLLPCCLFIYFYNGILNYLCVIASKTCRSRISGICQPLELLTFKKIKCKIISAIEADDVKWPIRIILYAKISFGGQSVMWGLPHRMWHDNKGPVLWDFREEMSVLVTVLGKVLRKTKAPSAAVCFLLIFYSIWTFIGSPDSSCWCLDSESLSLNIF